MSIEKMDKVWEYIWEKLFYPGTNLIYDMRTSFDEDGQIRDLPTLEEIECNIPNPCGWGTGMEDSMIQGPLLLEAVIDRYEATKDEAMLEYADKLLAGIRLCATVSRERGFLARSVSPIDGKSHYINSSRDQYTHVIYALYRYLKSSMMREKDREWITDVLVSFAERAEKNVTKENNDYDMLREDGKRSVVCRMWGDNLWGHEIHRLPMFYLVAWYVSGDEHWLELYKSIRDEANEKGIPKVSPDTSPFAFLQMQESVRILYDLDPDEEYKEKYLEILNFCADKMKGIEADYSDWEHEGINNPMPGWRTLEATNESGITLDGYLYYAPKTPYWKYLYTRSVYYAIAIQLMCPGREIPQKQIDGMFETLESFNKDTVCTSTYLFCAMAYWALKAAKII